MSLRDALLKSGAVSKKKVQQTNRELKKERKKKQAHREKKVVVETRQQQAEAAEKEARRQARLQARQESQAEASARGRALRVRHIVKGNAIQVRGGPVRFHHLDHERRLALKWNLPWSIAHGLRKGQYAIALLEQPYQEPEYVIIDRESALKVPSALLFFNEVPPPDEPEHALLEDCLS